MAEMGSQFVCLAHFSALQAKQHSQSMPKARQRGPEARQCTVLLNNGEMLYKCLKNLSSDAIRIFLELKLCTVIGMQACRIVALHYTTKDRPSEAVVITDRFF